MIKSKEKNKRGDLLIGDVIFIILNLIFLTILIVFVISRANDASKLEEQYAKQIALIIDSARPEKPGMIIHLNMEDAVKKAIDENQNLAKLVTINGNLVIVKLKEDGDGYSYSFFNDVDANAYFDAENNNQEYVITINQK